MGIDKIVYKKPMKYLLLISLVFALVLVGYTVHKNTTSEKVKDALRMEYPIIFGRGSKIIGPLTIEEIEFESLEKMSHCDSCPQVPFGYSNARWEKFKASIQDGDEIFYFSSDAASWRGLAGREGYVLIREDRLINVVITLMS